MKSQARQILEDARLTLKLGGLYSVVSNDGQNRFGELTDDKLRVYMNGDRVVGFKYRGSDSEEYGAFKSSTEKIMELPKNKQKEMKKILNSENSSDKSEALVYGLKTYKIKTTFFDKWGDEKTKVYTEKFESDEQAIKVAKSLGSFTKFTVENNKGKVIYSEDDLLPWHKK